MSDDFDTTRLTLLLSDLRLPALKQIWPTFAERSDQEGWCQRSAYRSHREIGI